MVSFSPHCASSSLYCQVSCQRSKELSLRASHPCGSPSVVNLCPGPCIPRPSLHRETRGAFAGPQSARCGVCSPARCHLLAVSTGRPLSRTGRVFSASLKRGGQSRFLALRSLPAPSTTAPPTTHRKPGSRGRRPLPPHWPGRLQPARSASPPLIFLIFILTILI